MCVTTGNGTGMENIKEYVNERKRDMNDTYYEKAYKLQAEEIIRLKELVKAYELIIKNTNNDSRCCRCGRT